MICPQCGSADWIPKSDEYFANCMDCGYVAYDIFTKQIIAEVQREQAQCKQILGYVPTYQEAVKKGLIKP